MKCYNCGCELSENDFCTACGADVGMYKKILMLSNGYYNEGLRKAQVRDLSGAIKSLRQSLKCNKYNTDARNLLGLVYFEMGEAVDAIAEWVLSKNFQPKKNIADDFLNEVQSNPTKWDNVRQTIKKYNQALDYCRQDSLDLAVIQLKSLLKSNPNMVKGHQLLALLYMNNEEWEKARRCVVRAQKIDTNNTTTLLYAKEIEDAIAQRDEMSSDSKKKKKQRDDIITYQNGNETIIQPINHPERLGGATVINILLGLIIGVAMMWFLVLPSRISSAQSEVNKDMLEVSNQLTEKSASLDELKKRTDALEAENGELLKQIQEYTGGDGLIEASDTLMNASRRYIESPEEVKDIADTLNEIDEVYITGDESTSAFQSLYQTLSTVVGSQASQIYLKEGQDYLKDENFEDAIKSLSKAYEMDSENGEALYNLAQAYRRSDMISKATETYRLVMKQFPDTEYAKNAKEYVEDGNESAVSDGQQTTQLQEQAEPVVEPQVVLPEAAAMQTEEVVNETQGEAAVQ